MTECLITRFLKKLAVCAFAIGVSGGIATYPARAADAWASPRKVTTIYPRGDGFTFTLDGPAIGGSPSPCGNRMFLPLAQAGNAYGAITAAIITAFSMNLNIAVAYDNATLNQCDIIINRVEVYR
jgi:hypothetical protein